MSDARPEPAAPAPPTSLRQAASSAGLLVVVLAILLSSRWLRSGPPEHRPATDPPPMPSLSAVAAPEGFAQLERVAEPPPSPAPTPEPAPDAALAALAQRAAADAGRLAKRTGGWTVQVSRHCSAPLVQDKLRRYGASRELLLIPSEQGDRACFVVCWGTYADRAAATKGIAAVPADLKGDGKPFARPIAEVMP